MDNDQFQELVLQQFDRINSRLDSLEKGQANLEQGQERLSNRLDSLEDGQESMSSRLGRLEKGQDSLVKGQENLRKELRDFKTETITRLDNLQKQNDVIAKQTLINYEAINAVAEGRQLLLQK